MKRRIENDLIGAVAVPSEAPYGGQTQRALTLYGAAGQQTLADYPDYLGAALRLKRVAAKINDQIGAIPADQSSAIQTSVSVALEHLQTWFPVSSLCGGGGIATNMNLNEVLANHANWVSFAQPYGSYHPIHPNEQVNLNHSTQDILSTASHVAAITRGAELSQALEHMAQVFGHLSELYGDHLKLARTCLQDAAAIRFGDVFRAQRTWTIRNQRRIQNATDQLYGIALGANILGRPGDTPAEFIEQIPTAMAKEFGSNRYFVADDLIDATQSHDSLVQVAVQVSLVADGLIKLAKDYRLMSSGPTGGLGEIMLPAVQPGSSAMPGKVNPAVPEYLIQCAIQAQGHCQSAKATQALGELDLNVFQGVLITNVLDAMRVLTHGIEVFSRDALAGVQINTERNQSNLDGLIPLLVQAKQQFGYQYASYLHRQFGNDAAKIKAAMKNKAKETE